MRRICYVKQGDIIELKDKTRVMALQDYWKGGSIYSISADGTKYWITDSQCQKILKNIDDIQGA